MRYSILLALTALAVGGPGSVRGQGQPQAAAPTWTPAPDWPTYMHDEAASGTSGQPLAWPLALRWTHRAAAPAPSWPQSAKVDVFHGNRPIRNAVTFDHACHLVGADERVFFGSSADDSVHCLSLATGQALWSFTTEGPVRLAPTLAGGKLLVGSDDGALYALAPADGRLLWKARPTETDTRIAGNGRIISLHPIRTNVLVAGNAAHFCAGLFPDQGVYYATADLATGKITSLAALPKTAQGYLRAAGGQIHCQAGIDTGGLHFAAKLPPAPPNTPAPPPAPATDPKNPRPVIACPNARITAGDADVSAADLQGKPLWSAKVEGRPLSLAIVGPCLLVSTDKGVIHCFGPGASANPAGQTPGPAPAAKAPADPGAAKILQAVGPRRGYALLVAPATPALPAAIAGGSQLKVVCAVADPARAAALRAALAPYRLGGRVSVIAVPAGRLPFGDYLFNAVVADPGAGWAREELLRVTAPSGGLLLAPDGQLLARRPALGGAGEWSHAYADPGNTACSGDQLTSGPLALQWFGEPGPAKMVDRHNRAAPPLSVNGRLFISGLDYLYALDAYNGAVLWEMPLPDSHRLAMPRSSGNMAASPDHLFAATGPRALQLDAATGKQLAAFSAPTGREWGILYLAGGRLLGSGNRPGAARWPITPNSWQPGYSPNQPVVVSDSLFAFDTATGRQAWTYAPAKGAIPNPAVALAGDSVFFLESANPATREAAGGRVGLGDLLARGVDLVALNLADGQVRWRKPLAEPTALTQTLWLQHARGTLLVSGSLLIPGGKRGQRIRYLLAAYSASDGKPLWNLQHVPNSDGSVHGSHGELTQHPAIVGDSIYLAPARYELATGKPVPAAGWRSSCGPISASAVAMFYRAGNPIIQELAGSPARPITPSTRPGCWINIIPAAGLILIPEASSGCTCAVFGIQTSFAMRPAAPRAK